MRIQVYEEELGEGVQLIVKRSTQGEPFYGLRIWLKTAQPLLDHSTPEDDDRSAVTFWARDPATLKDLCGEMVQAFQRGIARIT
jgi:hypothetical protein